MQYMVAFKEHMSATNMQIEALRKEIASKNKKDMASKAIELLSKDVKKYKEHCDILYKEREKLAEENKDMKEKISYLELDNHNLKTLLMNSKIETRLLKEDLKDAKKEEYTQLGISGALREKSGHAFRVNHYSTSIEPTTSRSRENLSVRDSLVPQSAHHYTIKDPTADRSRSEYSRPSQRSRTTEQLPRMESKLRSIVRGTDPKQSDTTSKRMVLKERVNTTGIRLGKNRVTGGLNMSMALPE